MLEIFVAKARDPFLLALGSVRDRAELGCYAPGEPIVIIEEARRLKLSTTPVREALAWLCGEGLIERGPAGGFLAPRLDAAMIRSRHGFRLLCLTTSLDMTADLADRAPYRREIEDPLLDLGHMLERLVRRAGNPVLANAFGRVGRQLAMLRNAEARVFGNLETEAAAILTAANGDLGKRIEDYHHRRMEAATLLMLEVETGRYALIPEAEE